jgi:periplasmic copper chaperone A
MRPLAAALLVSLLASHAHAQSITVDHAWSRPASAGRVGVAYFTINDADGPDRLTGASSPVADQAQLHETISENGISKMRPMDGVPVEAGKPVLFAPGGYHVMLMGLHQALKPGQSFPLTLTFEHAGPIEVSVAVQAGAHGNPTGTVPGMGAMPGMGGMSH